MVGRQSVEFTIGRMAAHSNFQQLVLDIRQIFLVDENLQQ